MNLTFKFVKEKNVDSHHLNANIYLKFLSFLVLIFSYAA